MAECPDDITEEELSRFLDGLPRRYLSVFGLSAIYRHVRLARGLRPDELHLSLEKRDEIWELTVAALDKPFLFSNISGVLASFGMDIHRGQAMTTPDHLVLDVFEFTDEEGFLRQNTGARDEIARVLRGVVRGRRRHPRAAARAASAASCTGGAAEVETRVHLDNDHSRRYTVLEIVTADAPGLLYRISRAVSDAGLRRGSRADFDRRPQGHRRAACDEAGPSAGRATTSAALKQELERTLEATYEAD